MAGIPSHLSNPLREALAGCEQFETNRSLSTTFAHELLKPFRNNLPQADTLMGRVDAVIGYLHDKRRRDGSNALVLLLHILSDQIDPEDDRHHQLASLANELEQALGGGASPSPRPATGRLAASKTSTQVSQPATDQIDPAHATSGKSQEEQPKTKSKDFFISYNRHDRQWAEWIAWQLEAAGYTIVIQAWDFRPGGNFVAEMQRATADAERTIAVLSADYLASRFTQPEWNAAFAQDPTGEKGLLLPVRVGECKPEGLLPQIVYIDLVGFDEEEAKKELLAGVKRGRAKPSIAPGFPGSSTRHTIPRPLSFPGDWHSDSFQTTMTQIQLIVSGELSDFTDERRNILVEVLASILGVEQSKIRILKVQPGSIRVTVEIPQHALAQLNVLSSAEVSLLVSIGVQSIEGDAIKLLDFQPKNIEMSKRSVDFESVGERPKTSLFTHGYALLIGVGTDLPVTVKDASGLRDILIDSQRCAYRPDHVKLLTQSQATRQGILEGFDWLIGQVKNDPEATVVIYFSGHGGLMPNYHLVPYGYQATDLAGTAISGVEFTKKLEDIRAKKLLILLDCCHAGGIAEVKNVGFTKSPVPPELNEVLTVGSGRVVIASSRRDEYSYTGTPYSVFTQALREGLAGYGAAERDGYAYVADVAMYVGRVVPERTKDRQHPILKLAAADNFAIAHYAGGDKSPKTLLGAQSYPSPIEVVEVDLVGGYRNILKRLQSNLLRVEERMAEFYDEAAIPLDLERTKEGILKRIGETEARIEIEAKKSGWTPPSVEPVGPTLEDVMRRFDELELNLGDKLDNLKRGQSVIYRRLATQDQVILEEIRQEIRQGRIEQAQVANTVEAVRKALKYFLANEATTDAEIKQTLDDIYQAVNSNLDFQQQLELTLPVIPFLLEYKVGLGAGVDLGAVWQELRARIRGRN